MQVPGSWEDNSGGELVQYDGTAWYRCQFRIPANWKGKPVRIALQGIDNAYEVYVDGNKVGGAGAFPPDFKPADDKSARLTIPADAIRFGDLHWMALRIYNHNGLGGPRGAAPVITGADEAVQLRGGWEFRTGDDLAWAKPDQPALPEGRPFEDIVKGADVVAQLILNLATPKGLPADEAMRRFEIPDDLALDLVLAEPIVEQPVFIMFDERGRLWVVQYRQYPEPAGLKMLSRDKFWRAVYDKVPAAPPHHTPGKDKITIHEDTDGDGAYDSHKTFLEGLNICTAVERGRGGVWVLNPPYLLFYADRDQNDVPDGDPEVHLAGFGLEDTHSVANSLAWGPDGWLYGAQGSTVTGNIMRPGIDKKPIVSMGQLLWRYHPETRAYEIFAEGGGNTFGVEFDSKGRVFSGHNGGDTRGFHYIQGGYYQKGFSKHGPLSNPYSFGYFPQMHSPPVARFTHTLLLYDGNSLPPSYHGLLLGVSPLESFVVASRVIPQGSTFRTQDVGHPMKTTDTYFKPVDIKVGPDGAVYVADWYDHNVNHYRNHEGKIDPATGRIYRLRAKSPLSRPESLGALDGKDLVARLSDPNEWTRRTAQRLLADRKDSALLPLLVEILRTQTGQPALEALWAIHNAGGWSEAIALEALDRDDPHVRRWAVRFIGDSKEVPKSLADRLTRLAREESDVETRSQIGSTCKRLPAAEATPILLELMARDEDAEDPHIPLVLWWSLESHLSANRDLVLRGFEQTELWERPIVERHLLNRLMRRFASAGSRGDLLICAKLLEQAPNDTHRKQLIAGFEQAFAGRSLAAIPDELAQALAKHGGSSLPLGLRLGRKDAIESALALLADPATSADQKLPLVTILGEVPQPNAVPALIQLLQASEHQKLRSALLTALASYKDASVGQAILQTAIQSKGEDRELALATLVNRVDWSRILLEAVETNKIPGQDVSPSLILRLSLHREADIRSRVVKRWGELQGVTSADAQQKIDRCRNILSESGGTPYNGYKVFAKSCARCHRLFEEGGTIGPDLTSYKRNDLDSMLLATVNPSAEVREGFETYLAYTADGRAITGFIADQDPKVVVLRNAEGQTFTLERSEIDELEKSTKSLMPDGLLNELSPQELRDLFAYLRSTQPLNQ